MCARSALIFKFAFIPSAVGDNSYLNGDIGQDPDSTVPGSNPAQTFTQAFGVGPIRLAACLCRVISR